jgi:hypothetical protein
MQLEKNIQAGERHAHQFTRSKPTASVETCACGKFRFTEHAGEPIVEQPAQCTMIVPSNIQAAITGVGYARIFGSGIVELNYTDGSKESAAIATPTPSEFFALVSAVQDKRTKAEGRAL